MRRESAVAEWSGRSSVIHRRDARIKLILLLLVLVAIALTPFGNLGKLLAPAIVIGTGIVAAGLPVPAVALRSAAVLPFALAAAAWPAFLGQWHLAAAVCLKALLSAAAVLLLAGTTPAPRLFDALERVGCPRQFALLLQMIYRFLSVLSEQSMRMMTAARARRGDAPARKLLVAAGAATVGALFLSAHARSERVHRGMLSRGFSGRLPVPARPRVVAADWILLAGTAGVLLTGLR